MRDIVHVFPGLILFTLFKKKKKNKSWYLSYIGAVHLMVLLITDRNLQSETTIVNK